MIGLILLSLSERHLLLETEDHPKDAMSLHIFFYKIESNI